MAPIDPTPNGGRFVSNGGAGRLLRFTARTRRLRPPVRLGVAAGMVLAGGFLRWSVLGATATNPFMFIIPVALLAAVLFDEISALLALLLSAMLGIVLFVGVDGMERRLVLVSLVFYLSSGGIAIWLIGTLHRAYEQLLRADAELQSTVARLQATQEEREVLIREATHRRGNDLQSLMATLRLQAKASPDPQVRAALGEAERRVLALARVEERLSTQRSPGNQVDAAALLTSMMQDVSAFSDTRQGRISWALDAETLFLPVETAMVLTKITLELFSNAMKYAFPDPARPGRLQVTLRRLGAEGELVVQDDGMGFDPAQPPRGSGLGCKLVTIFAQQIGGRISRDTQPGAGTQWCLCFPLTGSAPPPVTQDSLAPVLV